MVDYLYYVLAVLVIGLISFSAVRFATRAKNPDLVLQYEARKKAARKVAAESARSASGRINGRNAGQENPAIKSLSDRHVEKTHHLTPWGWPGIGRQAGTQGVSQAVRGFTDRLIKEKQVLEAGNSRNTNGSIRALLEDRYGPVNKGMTEVPYQKVRAPLLRDPSEQHDQLDNLGSAETRRLRQKLQFLSAMNIVEDGSGNQAKSKSKVEFRYVELKDLKQPWGW